MNFTDYVLVRLADPATRGSFFDQTSLESLANTAYPGEFATLTGPYQPLFDDFSVGVSFARQALVDGWLQHAAVRTELRLGIAGLSPVPDVRVDALWRGGIIARVAPATTPIVDLRTAWPDPTGVDSDIVADLGALPTDPAVLEAERRRRFVARIRAAMRQPDAFTDARFDAWLARVGAAGVGDLLTRLRGQMLTGALRLTFGEAPAGDPLPRILPIAAALFVRDAGFSVSTLLAETKAARAHLADTGLERLPSAGTGKPPTALAIWVVPETTFDDAGWPGGDAGANPTDRRTLRRAAAAAWLARESISVLTAASPP